ncbi:hypothetical protein [Rhizobium sp. 11_C7_N12_5]
MPENIEVETFKVGERVSVKYTIQKSASPRPREIYSAVF